jgi:thioredoxin-related protein
MKIKLIGILSITLIVSTLSFGAGKITGGSMHEIPSWFKSSFLDMTEDTVEAAEENRHVMLFLDLDGCPYCTRMLKESFMTQGPTQTYIKEHFDVININVKGSREIVWNEDETYTEKELAQKLNVPYSPTVLILDEKQNIVVRLNGYRNPVKFKQVLEYAHNKHYKSMQLTEYLQKVETKTVYTLKDNDMFKNMTDLSKTKTPLAIIFEDGGCFDCDYFHEKTLKNKEVQDAFAKFDVVRFDAMSDTKIVTPEGKTTTVKEWLKEINLDYRPGILLYNEGKLISTQDALLYSFHFKELLLYVANSEYKNYPSYLDYLRVKQDKLLSEGVNINLAK